LFRSLDSAIATLEMTPLMWVTSS